MKRFQHLNISSDTVNKDDRRCYLLNSKNYPLGYFITFLKSVRCHLLSIFLMEIFNTLILQKQVSFEFCLAKCIKKLKESLDFGY